MPKSTVNSGVSNADAEPGQPGYIPKDETAAVEGLGYDVWTKDELVAELDARGLPKSGNKPELIERLDQDDLAKAADAEGEAAEVTPEPVADENSPEGG
jgi:hypothetical protein